MANSKKSEAAPAGTMLVARQSFAYTDEDGTLHVIRAGKTRVAAGHPLLDGREELFEPVGVHYDVEQATAAPGEKRGEQG